MNRDKSEESAMRCIAAVIGGLVLSILYCIGMALAVPGSMN